MTTKLFWIKWYLAAWLSSETRLSSDASTRGVYRDLIDLCYLNDGIPSDRESMIRIACVTAEEFDRAWPKIAHKFIEIPGRPGRLTTARVEEVFAESGYSRDLKVAARRLGAEARWNHKQMAPAIAPAMAPGMASQSQSQSQSQISDSEKGDLDCPLANRKRRGSQADVGVASYPKLIEALTHYRGKRPSDRTAVDILHVAGGASEAEVVGCLAYLWNERGLRPGTEHGPETWAWFKTTVQDYFTQKHARDEVANPCGYAEWQERNEAKEEREQFECMAAAIELPGEG